MNELAKILDEHGMVQNPETGMFEVKTEGGIPEAGVSEAELKEIIEESNIKNFREPVTGKINYTKLANFTDPVTKIVGKLKERSYNDSEITEILEKHGMGWDPETGATWIGLSSEDLGLKHLPPRYDPFSESLEQEHQLVETRGLTQKYQLMRTTNDVIYRGIDTNIKSGSCAAEEGETTDHVVTTHVGRGGHWAEAGIYKGAGGPTLWLFTYDDDEYYPGTESHWGWHGTTSATTYNDIIIQVLGSGENVDYGIWINGKWVRLQHLPYEGNGVDQANEVWTNTGIYTPDTIAAYHTEPHLYDIYGSYIWWDTYVGTEWKHNFWPPYPVKEDHWMGTHAWVYKTWVET